MLKAARIVSVLRFNTGNRSEYGVTGYDPAAKQLLIFPGSVRKFEGRRIVGINYDLLAEEKVEPKAVARPPVPDCPRTDCESTHSADVDYAEFLPCLFQLRAGNFYIAHADEVEPIRVFKIIGQHLKPGQRAFIGVVSPHQPPR